MFKIISSLLLFLEIFLTGFAYGASERIGGLDMKSCLPTGDCLQVYAEKGQRALYDDMFAIRSITLTWHNKGTKTKSLTIYGTQGFIDLDINHLIIRGIEGQPYSEMIVSLKTHKVMKF